MLINKKPYILALSFLIKVALKRIVKAVPDTSAIINEVLSKEIIKEKLAIKEVLIHQALLSELEHQANSGKETGFIGLDEIKKLKELKVKITLTGARPTIEEIKFAKKSTILRAGHSFLNLINASVVSLLQSC